MTGSFVTLNIIFLFFSTVFGQYGIKGGHYQQTGSSRPTNETGYCYKRVPYQPTKSSGSQVETGYNQGNQQNSNAWTTIIDCCDGYERNVTTGRCESNCETNCFGGQCVDNICKCESGWQHSDGVCKPICRQGCFQNAYCFAPDICECKFGWEKSSGDQCRPVCPGGCINGRCIGPRVCECSPGFILNEGRQSCEAICEGGCPHGECKTPGQCTCYPGYVNPPGDRESCVPDCSQTNCEQSGGQCTSPGVCICRPGYTRDSKNNCIPECQNGCPINGRCVSPDNCVCNSGFALDYRNNRCVPVDNQNQPGDGRYHPQDGQSINGGRYSPSSGNGQSTINQQSGRYNPGNGQSINQQGGGYQQNENYCERPCINGECMGYNVCNCKNGYTPDPRDMTRTRCLPVCPGGCPNGTCSGPNFCICNPGFVKDRSGVKGSQRCIPRENY